MALIHASHREIRFFYIAILIIIGILSAQYIPHLCPEHIVIFTAFPIVLYFLCPTRFKPRIFPFIWMTFFFSIGILLMTPRISELHEIDDRKIHFSDSVTFLANVSSVPIEKTYYQIAQITPVKVSPDVRNFLVGEVLIKIYPSSGDTQPPQIQIGDTLSGIGFLRLIPKPLNQNTFSAKDYYRKKNIHFELRVRADDIDHNVYQGVHLKRYSHQLQRSLSIRISSVLNNANVASLLQAILLGNKLELSDELYNTFSSTGASHILAVSGFHVGLIYLLLTLIFGKPSQGSVPTRMIRSGLIITGIWTFAMITGLAASTTRAATMITIFMIGRSMNRPVSVWNVLGLTACILVMTNPNIVYDVGFQFSFSAVAGILLLLKPLKQLFITRIFLFDWLYTCMILSITAQFLLLPLSIYYFHRFPITSMISGWIAIPAAIILVCLGILLLIFSCLPMKIDLFIGHLIDLIGEYFIQSLEFIGQFQIPGWDRLYLDTCQIMTLSAGSLAILIYWNYKRIAFLLIGFLMLSYTIYQHKERLITNADINRVVISHQYNAQCIYFQNGRNFDFFSLGMNDQSFQFLYRKSLLKSSARKVNKYELHDDVINANLIKRNHHFFWNDHHFEIVDETTESKSRLRSLPYPTYLWIIQAPIDGIGSFDLSHVEHVIIHPTVKPWHRESLIQRCLEEQIEYYDISSLGQFTLTR